MLQHNIKLSNDGTARLTFIITNISGRRIRSPIMLISSLLGYFVFTNGGIEAGETKKITELIKYKQRKLSNVSFFFPKQNQQKSQMFILLELD